MALQVKRDLNEITRAPDRAAATLALDTFVQKYGAKYEKAVACLERDRNALLAFFDFPAEHWDHLRTANPIESVFATVRHRTVRTKGALNWPRITRPIVRFEAIPAGRVANAVQVLQRGGPCAQALVVDQLVGDLSGVHALSQHTALLMVFKLLMAASRTWRRLKGQNQLPKVITGVTFRDGVEVTTTSEQRAA